MPASLSFHLQGAFFRNHLAADRSARVPSGGRRALDVQNVERRSAPANPINALPDNSSQIGSSVWNVCGTTETIPAVISARPYAAALPAAMRTRTIPTNAFMFQPVAYVSGTVSYFACFGQRAVTLCKDSTRTLDVSGMAELYLSRTRYFQLNAAVC